LIGHFILLKWGERLAERLNMQPSNFPMEKFGKCSVELMTPWGFKELKR
jgi:hypothetical protein